MNSSCVSNTISLDIETKALRAQGKLVVVEKDWERQEANEGQDHSARDEPHNFALWNTWFYAIIGWF